MVRIFGENTQKGTLFSETCVKHFTRLEVKRCLSLSLSQIMVDQECMILTSGIQGSFLPLLLFSLFIQCLY